MADEPAVDIGEAIQRGVELLAQQSVETPKFKLATVADLYREGVRATKSRAPAARVLEAWSGAAAEMPAPLPVAIGRAPGELDTPAAAGAVLAAHPAATATKLAKAQAQGLPPALAPAAPAAVPRGGAGARLAMARLVQRAPFEVRRGNYDGVYVTSNVHCAPFSSAKGDLAQHSGVGNHCSDRRVHDSGRDPVPAQRAWTAAEPADNCLRGQPAMHCGG